MLRMNTEKRRQIIGNENISRTKIRKIDFLPELNMIKFVSVPSLESMAIIKIATELCKQPDIRDAIRKHSLKFDPDKEYRMRGPIYDKSFEQIKNNILNKLSLVSLPNLLKAKVSNVISPLKYQIYEWLRNRKDIDYMESIYWSNEGTIDVVKSFDQLMNNVSTNCSKDNFEMACRYCLEDYIPALFNQLPEKVRNEYFCSKRIYENYENHLIAYWASSLKNDLNELLSKLKLYDDETIYHSRNSVYQNMFALAISEGNILAVKYFWKKLTACEISNSLVQWVNESSRKQKDHSSEYYYQKVNNYSNVTYFLLSQINDAEQLREVLQINSDVIFHSLCLDWPWQRFLFPTLHSIWSFVSGRAYSILWYIISKVITQSSKTTENLLSKLWLDTPINLKKCFIQYIIESLNFKQVLCKLLSIKYLHTVKLILNHANIEEKRRIMFSFVSDFNFEDRSIIFADRVAYLNILIKETLSTESDVCNLKERIVLQHGKSLCTAWIRQDNLQAVELFFNWAFYSDKKRNAFKNEVLDAFGILYSILIEGDYELADKIVNWYNSTDQEIGQFKKDFAKSKCEIVELADDDWDIFEKFISWCFLSDKDIDELKSHLLRSPQLTKKICSTIARRYNFEFADKLIVWCCLSNEEVKLYKEKLVLSNTLMNLLKKFVNNTYKIHEYDLSNNWKLIQKLIKFLSPLEQKAVNYLKEKIKTCIDFEFFFSDSQSTSVRIKQKDLFCLIDKYNSNIVDDKCSCAHDSESSAVESSDFNANAE